MKSKAIMISAAVVLLCAAIVIGASFALFSQQTAVETYLSAGRLSANLVRTDLKGQFVDGNGILGAETTVDEDVDLSDTDNTTNAAFAFGSNSSVIYNVPGVWEEAFFRLTNSGNVAFDSTLAFSFVDNAPSADTPESRLADKLVVTVSDNLGSVLKTGSLTEVVNGGAITLNTRQLAGGSFVFRIKIELPYESDSADDGTGETIMNANLRFTFTVTATQTVEEGAISD